MVEKERIIKLNNNKEKKGDYILYWMQASQRVYYNHALNYAIEIANKFKLPLLVVFGLTPHYPDANLRHYKFMLEGLKETFEVLQQNNIGVKLELYEPYIVAIKNSAKATCVITDRGYTDIQKKWRIKAAKEIKTAFYQVESDVIVPVETVSDREEYSTATLRKKIIIKIPYFLKENKFIKPVKKFNKKSFI